jgi:prefoldin beta subunit
MDNPELQKLQTIEAQAHAHAAQRAGLQAQLSEVDNALKEMIGASDTYRIIGNIMVKSDAAKLSVELQEKKAVLQTRMASAERQEKRLREEMESLQGKILGAQ